MKFLKDVIDRVKREKSGGLVAVAIVYSVTLVALLIWPLPAPECRVVSPLDVLQCAVLSTHPWILAIVGIVMGGTLLATYRRPDWYVVRRNVTVGGVIVYVLLVGSWVAAYSLL